MSRSTLELLPHHFGEYSCAQRPWTKQLIVQRDLYGWGLPTGCNVCLTPMLFPKLVNAKQANNRCLAIFQVFRTN